MASKNVVDLHPQVERLANMASDLHHQGSGRGGGDMEARVAKLEALAESTDRRLTTVEQDLRDMRRDMRSDFRLTWGGIIMLGLLMAGAWVQMDLRADRVDASLADIKAAVTK